MDRRVTIVSLLVCVAAFIVCGWSLLLPTKSQLFGSETIRRRLRFPHWLVMFGAAVVPLGMVFAKTWFAVLEKSQHAPPQESDFLSLATILVLFMLFGFVAFEAGTVSSAYRNQSAEKNLLVIMVSLASYLGIGRFIYDGFADKPTVALTWIVFQAGFACTVSLIISNALTERASKPTNVLCAIFAAGLGYPVLAGLVWGDTGLLHHIGFVDASGASAVHLLGASASLTATAAVGPRVRLQRWRFLGGPETPDFSSPWSVVGGLFLMFGWLGFNSGNAVPALHGHAFINTMAGACSGAVAAWLLSRGVSLLIRVGREFVRAESRQTSLTAIFEGLEARPRIVIGMMGGLVAVTANGALPEINSLMAAIESFAGGIVAVLVSSWMSARLRSGQIDDPLGVIATHGCAAIVGILSTALWFATVGKPFLPQVAVQLIGCGACIVVGWLVAMVPCQVLLTTERLALGKTTGSWTAAKFRLRLGAIEQLGTPRETPVDLVWNDRIEEATQRILHGVEGDPNKWWDAVEIYATAAEVLDKSSQANIAHRIVEKLPETIGWPETERVALVALGSSAEYARPEDISSALAQCIERAESDDGHAGDEAQGRREMLVWSVALLTERAAVLGKAARPDVLPQAQEGVRFLRKVAMSDKNYRVRDLARIGVIDAKARLLSDAGGDIQPHLDGPFDHDGQWQIVYALITDKSALAMLLFLAERHSAVIADAAETFKKTREEMLEIATLLASHELISCNPKRLTINASGLQLVNRLHRSVHPHERLRA
jgi:ammonia channel protein AmtB